MDVCQFEINRCGYVATVGCKKPFCFDHRAIDPKRELPKICVDCREGYFVAQKKSNCCLAIVVCSIIVLVSATLLAAIVVINLD